MNCAAALSFRDTFRQAREAAQQDAEDFEQVVFALEKLGLYLCATQYPGLGKYERSICTLALKSPLAMPTTQERPFSMPFRELFDLVRQGRNGAMHEGVFARILTQHAIQIAIVIEDALAQIITMPVGNKSPVTDFMIRNPIYAEMWQPVSFIRQQMLANSFSFLPVRNEGNTWHLVSDLAVADYLRCHSRKEKLAQTLSGASMNGLKLQPAYTITESQTLDDALNALREEECPPILLVVYGDTKNLLGIITPFDLL